jgi:hypothetical protein
MASRRKSSRVREFERPSEHCKSKRKRSRERENNKTSKRRGEMQEKSAHAINTLPRTKIFRVHNFFDEKLANAANTCSVRLQYHLVGVFHIEGVHLQTLTIHVHTQQEIRCKVHQVLLAEFLQKRQHDHRYTHAQKKDALKTNKQTHTHTRVQAQLTDLSLYPP